MKPETNKHLTAEMIRHLAEFALRNPKGFASALINTVDTSRENPDGNWPLNATQADRETQAINFLLGHDDPGFSNGLG